MSLCFSGAMPMPVSLTASATTLGARLSTGWSGLQPSVAPLDAHRDVPLRGELERVRQQVLEDLLQPLRVGGERARQGRVDLDRGRPGSSTRRRGGRCARPLSRSDAKRDLLGLDRDRARLDLRQVEDVVDEREQVGAGRVDVLRELDLLRRSGCRRRSRRAAGRGSGSS